MKNEIRDPAQLGLARESEWQFDCRLVRSVIEAYSQVKKLPVICAIGYDPSSLTRSRRVSPDSIHYVTDVEHAVRDVCQGDPELESAWNRLLEDDSVISNSDARAIRRLAKVFVSRELHPSQYFRIIRHGSPKRRQA
jgi:hypothetical protein